VAIFKSSIACLVILSALTTNCKKKEKSETEEDESSMTIQPSVLRLEVEESADLVKTWKVSNLAEEQVFTNDVTILSLKYPIGSISLGYDEEEGGTGSGENAFPVYECAGTSNDECLVDLASTALEDLLEDAPALAAPEGTYNKLTVSPCYVGGDASDMQVKMTAEATISGVKYYTSVDEGLSLTGPAEEITFSDVSGCGNVYYLLEQLVIGDGEYKTEPVATEDEEEVEEEEPILTDTIPVKLYFDIANAAVASGGTSNAGASAPSGTCYGPSSQTPYICINFPSIAGTVDSETPSVKRFLISESGTSGTFSPTIFGFYFGSKDVPFGAYQRNYASGENYVGSIPQSLMGPTFKRFTYNDDGSFNIDTYSSWLKIDDFKLEAHTGTVVLNNADNPSANPDSILNGTFTYSAELME
jgi:hypothetical protein